MSNKYDIFISYRRKDAGDKAEHLKDLLEPYYKGRISFDRENLTGKFNVQLIERIDHVKDFLLVIGKNSLSYNNEDKSKESIAFYNELTSLSQDAFARRINELGTDANIDYVRIEIGRALRRNNLHIIPVVPERSQDFNFAALDLPSDMAGIKAYEAVFYSESPDALFKDVVPKVRKHLKSKSDFIYKKIWLAVILFLIIISFVGMSGWFYYQQVQVEHSRVALIDSLDMKYKNFNPNFNPNISIEKLHAVQDILEKMEFVEGGSFMMGPSLLSNGTYNEDVEEDLETPPINIETTLDVVEGMQFDKGYLSPYFVTNAETMEAVLENPYILIHEKKINNLKDFLPLLEKVAKSGRPFLVIAEDIEGEALATLVVNRLRGVLNICAVKAPGFGDRRKAMMEDIAILTGGKCITEDLGIKLENVGIEDLGQAKRVVVSKDETVIVEGSGKSSDIEARISQIRRQIKDTTSGCEWETTTKTGYVLKLFCRPGAGTTSALRREARLPSGSASTGFRNT